MRNDANLPSKRNCFKFTDENSSISILFRISSDPRSGILTKMSWFEPRTLAIFQLKTPFNQYCRGACVSLSCNLPEFFFNFSGFGIFTGFGIFLAFNCLLEISTCLLSYFILGQAEEVPGDCWPPDRTEELRSPEGQAFLRHRQVCGVLLHLPWSQPRELPHTVGGADPHPGS